LRLDEVNFENLSDQYSSWNEYSPQNANSNMQLKYPENWEASDMVVEDQNLYVLSDGGYTITITETKPRDHIQSGIGTSIEDLVDNNTIVIAGNIEMWWSGFRGLEQDNATGHFDQGIPENVKFFDEISLSELGEDKNKKIPGFRTNYITSEGLEYKITVTNDPNLVDRESAANTINLILASIRF